MIKACYIHIPFCKKICTYCDFCKIFYNKEMVNKYLESLEKEIDSYYKKEELKTLYIGGGTPSSLSMEELKKLFQIIKKMKLSKEIEFTFECNILDINEEILIFLKNNKVNRLSIGVESFNNKILKVLGRDYKGNEVKEKIELTKKYFNNINIDLIYGVNTQSIKDLKEDLNKFIELDINHISIYSLILEDNTILKINNYQEIEDDLNRDMYDYIVNFLEKNGYNHYEISNFSKPGYQSKHNLTYWDNDKYYGFGPGASGYIDDVRYTNTRSITKYNKGEYIAFKNKVSQKEDMENFMILGLRKIKGVSSLEFLKRYNKKIENVFNISKLKYKDGFYYIDKDDIYISNYILKDFIGVDYE